VSCALSSSGAGHDPRACHGIWKKHCPVFETLDLGWLPWDSAAVGEVFFEKQEVEVVPRIRSWILYFSWPRASPDKLADAMGCNPTVLCGNCPAKTGLAVSKRIQREAAVPASPASAALKHFRLAAGTGKVCGTTGVVCLTAFAVASQAAKIHTHFRGFCHVTRAPPLHTHASLFSGSSFGKSLRRSSARCSKRRA